jgi:hypothetical protein
MAWEASAEPARVSFTRQGPSDYLYALAEGLPTRWRPPTSGVGSSPVVVRCVQGVALITSSIDSAPRPTPRTVALHDEVISATLAAEAVLPLEFGTVTAAPHVDAWVATHLGFVRAHLAHLRRHVEMTIRLVSLASTAGSDASLRSTAECLVARAGLPEWRYQGNGPSGLSSSLAFLVPRDAVADFLARIAPVAARARTIAVVPTGPCAPLSFSPRLRTALVAPDRQLERAGCARGSVMPQK